MPTKLDPTTLTVSITESYELGGVAYGNSMNHTYGASGQVVQRVMSIAEGEGTFTDILNFGSADLAGGVVKADYKYFRIKNLDDTNFITLSVKAAADTFFVKIKAGETFLLMDNEMDAIASSASFGAFSDIEKISADADTAACDIEFVCVTT